MILFRNVQSGIVSQALNPVSAPQLIEIELLERRWKIKNKRDTQKDPDKKNDF